MNTHINGHDIKNGSGPKIDNSVAQDDQQKNENSPDGNSFYKLELVRIQLMSAHGQQVSFSSF